MPQLLQTQAAPRPARGWHTRPLPLLQTQPPPDCLQKANQRPAFTSQLIHKPCKPKVLVALPWERFHSPPGWREPAEQTLPMGTLCSGVTHPLPRAGLEPRAAPSPGWGGHNPNPCPSPSQQPQAGSPSTKQAGEEARRPGSCQKGPWEACVRREEAFFFFFFWGG